MATKPTRKVVLTQIDPFHADEPMQYLVEQITNTVEPAAGTTLHKRDVEALIGRGIQVTIRRRK